MVAAKNRMIDDAATTIYQLIAEQQKIIEELWKKLGTKE